jgi:hypothetical protein
VTFERIEFGFQPVGKRSDRTERTVGDLAKFKGIYRLFDVFAAKSYHGTTQNPLPSGFGRAKLTPVRGLVIRPSIGLR